MHTSKAQMSEDKRMTKEINNEQVNYYQKNEARHRIKRHKRIEESVLNNWRPAIGALETNGRLNIESVFLIIISATCKLNIDFTP